MSCGGLLPPVPIRDWAKTEKVFNLYWDSEDVKTSKQGEDLAHKLCEEHGIFFSELVYYSRHRYKYGYGYETYMKLRGYEY